MRSYTHFSEPRVTLKSYLESMAQPPCRASLCGTCSGCLCVRVWEWDLWSPSIKCHLSSEVILTSLGEVTTSQCLFIYRVIFLSWSMSPWGQRWSHVHRFSTYLQLCIRNQVRFVKPQHYWHLGWIIPHWLGWGAGSSHALQIVQQLP